MKTATTKTAILDVIKNRWSPRAFSDKAVSRESLEKLFEAASWAASSYNEQPWRFIVGIKGEGDNYDKIAACLNPWNQKWALSAPVLILVVGKKTFSMNQQANRCSTYDCGSAVGFLSLQAIAEDLYMHQMAGIFPEKAVETFQVPDDFEVITGIALGYKGELDRIEESFHESEKATRGRKPLSEIVFGGDWGDAF